MPVEAESNPYRLRPESIAPPPGQLRSIVKFLGPGLILTASVVGSGELVATTILGAENGFTLLWLILVSCISKVAIQHELGRYAIATGETTLQAFDRIPGPRWRLSWVVWFWVLLMILVMSIWGGILGAIGEILNLVIPSIPIVAWVWAVSLGSIVVLIGGRYAMVERVSVLLVAIFTFLTIGCAAILMSRPDAVTLDNILSGLTFKPPQGGLGTAVTVFGITGAAPFELVVYPYWCLEKGYARYSGPRDDTSAWRARASGWLRVMGLDILNSMVIYTVATIAFYFLGAGLLHGVGQVPSGAQLVQTQSVMFTGTLGDWALIPFYAGALAVLYSSLFTGVASLSRVLADMCGVAGFIDTSDYRVRRKAVRWAVVGALVAPPLTYTLLGEPVLLVKIGGGAQALGLPVLACSALYLRYRHLPHSLLPKAWMTAALWASAFVVGAATVYWCIGQIL